jgi:FkbM family methyltransferase
MYVDLKSYSIYDNLNLKDDIKNSKIFVDIGANIGFYSLLSAKTMNDKGVVYSFEPERINYELLTNNIALNNFTSILPICKAVSNNTGSVKFYTDKLESGGHSLFQDAVQFGKKSLFDNTIVDAIKLDDFFGGNQKIDLMKIDVQGAEYNVLSGARKVIRNNDAIKIILEFCPYNLIQPGVTPQLCWDALTSLGLKYKYCIHSNDNKLEKIELNEVLNRCAGTAYSDPTGVNLLCCKIPIY